MTRSQHVQTLIDLEFESDPRVSTSLIDVDMVGAPSVGT